MNGYNSLQELLSYDVGESIESALDTTGNIYTTGYSDGTLDFDSDTTAAFNLTFNGIANVFVHKMEVTTTQLSSPAD